VGSNPTAPVNSINYGENKMNPLDPGTHYQHIYVMHNGQAQPRITVCYIRSETDCAVGVAVCSFSDNPCKQTGRKIALDRANAALKEKLVRPLQRREAKEVIFAAKSGLIAQGKGLDLWRKSYLVQRPDYNILFNPYVT
jgi:hypothetical protein